MIMLEASEYLHQLHGQADKPVLVVQQLFNIGRETDEKERKKLNLFVAKEILAIAVKHVWQEKQKHQEILVSHLMTKKKKKMNKIKKKLVIL